MSYLVLARKYRPNTFQDVVGQSHITGILQSAVASQRLGQAYLFCGPRGIGKTSCARILAKALNCEQGVTAEPCGVCAACQSITLGNSFDVLEIDGASNRGIDEIRTIRENVKFAPGYGRYKVYIVDEVHMLTTEAFNALLKTLEEPPEHVKFIFATTDPNKLPATIVSRCQRFDFKRIAFNDLCEALEAIAQKETIDIERDALYAIAKAAKGSFRDALSVLDQVSALGGKTILSTDVYGMLGLVEMEMMFALAGALFNGDCAGALTIFDQIIDRGKDIKQLGRDLMEHCRHVMVLNLAGSSIDKIKEMGRLVDYPGEIKDQFLRQARLVSLPEVLAVIDILIEAQDIARVTESERAPMEIAFARIAMTLNRESTDAAAGPDAATQRADAEKLFAPGSMMRNEKGQVNASDRPSDSESPDACVEPQPEVTLSESDGSAAVGVSDCGVPEAESPQVAVSVPDDASKLRAQWSALTHAVSRERMSLATYLQEGAPLNWAPDGKLIIGFSPDHSFFKETLEAEDNLVIVERIFSEQLGRKVVIRYETMEGCRPVQSEDDHPVVQDVLKTFGGTIESRWHNE